MEVPSRQPGGLPAPQGLYDGRNEHDACGIGFLADVQGRRSHDILRDGVRLLNALAHRAAVGADPRTGDGAGILIQLPHRFFAEVATEHGFWLPEEGLAEKSRVDHERRLRALAQVDLFDEHAARLYTASAAATRR